MTTPDTFVAVLTYKGVDRILREGGTQSWRADGNRLRKTPWVVCARHLHGPHKPDDYDSDHKQAFMIAEIDDVVDADDGDGRKKITFRRFATFDGPIIPFAGKNPVQYFSLSAMGIDPEALTWKEFTSAAPISVVDRARGMIAEHYGVHPEAVQITITH